MKNLILIIALSTVSLFANSQDTLLLKTGKKIICKIINTDSSKVYFTVRDNNNNKLQTFVNQSEVQDIRYYKPTIENGSNQKHYNTVALSVGSSMPVGNFANDDVSSDGSGLAGNGLNINGIFTHYYLPELGIVVKGFYNSNEFKADKLSNMISSMTGYSVSNNSTSYSSYGLLVGITRVHYVDKLSIGGHLLLGFANLTEPRVTFIAVSGTNSGSVKMSEISASSLIYNIGAGLTYTLNDNWDLFADVDYLQGSYKFGSYSITNANGFNQSEARGTQNYGVINITIGLSLKIQ